MLKFKDGIQVDTNGDLRKLQLKDGWYVVGAGMLIPEPTEQDAERTIIRLQHLGQGVITKKEADNGR